MWMTYSGHLCSQYYVTARKCDNTMHILTGSLSVPGVHGICHKLVDVCTLPYWKVIVYSITNITAWPLKKLFQSYNFLQWKLEIICILITVMYNLCTIHIYKLYIHPLH